MKKTVLATTLALVFVAAGAKEDPAQGKRVDNARVDQSLVPPPTEIEPDPDLGYSLPSGVLKGQILIMKAAVADLPTAPAKLAPVLSDVNGSALFDSGMADLTPAAKTALNQLAQQLAGKPGLRLSVVGHTDDQRLSPNARKKFRDNLALSEARSLAVVSYLQQFLNLPQGHVAIEGFGERRPAADNASPIGMARNRRVEIRAWYDEVNQPVIPAADAPSRQPACSTELKGVNSSPFSITVDGEPLKAGSRVQEADLQRCTDVALEHADIQLHYDSLAIAPAMNVWATPNGVHRGERVEFFAWSNYIPWVKRAEVRLFRSGQKANETPFAVLPMVWDRPVEWQVPETGEEGGIQYLLRVYDEQGRFDETAIKPLTLLMRPRLPDTEDRESLERERLVGYGENSLNLRNIPVAGGTVTVNGRFLKPGQRIDALGQAVPVDREGRFAIKQILPAGPHSVEIRLTEPDGTTSTYRRNLNIAVDDWFYVALGDLTVGRNDVSGPARLVTNDTQHYEGSTYVDGRGAFYLKGKIKGEYLLTAAADTREQPVKNLFTNFTSKDPRYLLRNIDPNLYYPVYGDDSTTVDDAPTQGKFYVKLEKGDSHVMWGNFQTSWSGMELMQYSRALYGAKARFRSEDATSQGEKTIQVDAFAADPGTLSSREEFRGTGGSLYYLRHQDITMGAERVWVEVRDKDSGLVIERKQLTPAQDYEINYLQGRITLREPLSATASGGGLVMTSAVNGHPAYLVVTYEYVPGLTEVSSMATGLRASHWLNDHLQVGVAGYHQGDSRAGSVGQTLAGADATLRYKPNTWLRFETARSSGAGMGAQSSLDGGFGFNSLTATGKDANAYRVDAAVDLAEVVDDTKGKLRAYVQDREHGFSAPGQIGSVNEAVRQQGLKGEVDISPETRLEAKADNRNGEIQDASNMEVAVRQKLNSEWQAAVGVRRDQRQNLIANASPILSQNGGRTDAQLRFDYKPDRDGGRPGEKQDWETYAFVQGTLERDGTRAANDRTGLGGAIRLNDRVKLLGEVSDGSMGSGGKVGADYRLSDRSNAYLNYVVETESPDMAWRGRQGTWVSGGSTRVSDEVRLFGEAKATHGAGPQSLMQAFGVDWAPSDRWTYGGKAEFGTVSDPLAGDFKRQAIGVSTAYKEGQTKYSGGLEWREDESNLSGNRNTWLLRNSLGVQATKEWRLLGKLNVSRSINSQGAYQDGNFHEIVAATAYRPVNNDRWNTLFKYTAFYNVPTQGQLAPTGLAADYAQRSQVFAIDSIYDVSPWLSLGGKYAVRIGELKDARNHGDWFASRANLYVVRADFHWVKEWDLLLEFRRLTATEAKDARSGVLTGIYRHIGDGVKIGAGYNFTNYSDNLTDLSYRSRGWFVNVLGSI